MDNYSFFITDDNSTGLFDNIVNDIYHSKFGAKTEAFQKFVEPVLNNKKESINILDVCYGIGYNSKTFLEASKNKIIKIDALDFNSELIALSPLINDQIFNDYIKVELLNNVLSQFYDFNEYNYFIKSKIQKRDFPFFNMNIVNFIDFLLKLPYKNIVELQNNSNLHNIYYKYISTNNINDNIIYNKLDFSINFLIGDARKTIFDLQGKYDVVFLDGFSPQKSPILWTINFLSIIKNCIHKDSIITSYSKSTPFRNTLKQLGFYVGKTFIDDVDMGTVASLNKRNIINPLSEYDIKLLNTRSGIPYRDNITMSLNSTDIIKNREQEQTESDLLSQTQFLKNSKK